MGRLVSGVNQSKIQSTNQSTNQPTNQPINQINFNVCCGHGWSSHTAPCCARSVSRCLTSPSPCNTGATHTSPFRDFSFLFNRPSPPPWLPMPHRLGQDLHHDGRRANRRSRALGPLRTRSRGHVPRHLPQVGPCKRHMTQLGAVTSHGQLSFHDSTSRYYPTRDVF